MAIPRSPKQGVPVIPQNRPWSNKHRSKLKTKKTTLYYTNSFIDDHQHFQSKKDVQHCKILNHKNVVIKKTFTILNKCFFFVQQESDIPSILDALWIQILRRRSGGLVG